MSNYWAEREAKHIEEMLKRHVNYEQEIHRRYLQLWKTIEAEIQQFYVAYAGKRRLALMERNDVQVNMTYKFSRKSETLCTNKRFFKRS